MDDRRPFHLAEIQMFIPSAAKTDVTLAILQNPDRENPPDQIRQIARQREFTPIVARNQFQSRTPNPLQSNCHRIFRCRRRENRSGCWQTEIAKTQPLNSPACIKTTTIRVLANFADTSATDARWKFSKPWLRKALQHEKYRLEPTKD